MSFINRLAQNANKHYERNSNVALATLSRINNFAEYHSTQNYNEAVNGYSSYLDRAERQLKIAMYFCASVVAVGISVILISL